jgi:hypothetical protein
MFDVRLKVIRRHPLVPDQALGQGVKLGAAVVDFPDETAVFECANDRAAGGAAQGFDPVAWFQIGGLGETLDDFDHAFAVQHTGNVMGHGRHDLASTGGGEVGEKGGDDLPGNVGKGVAVEKKEGGTAMKTPQEFYELFEGEGLALLFRPLASARRLSLSIKAVLCASFCARSSVEADDKLPTPVFEELGSGL